MDVNLSKLRDVAEDRGVECDAVRSVQSLSRVRLCVTPWTATRQASLSIMGSQRIGPNLGTEQQQQLFLFSGSYPISS